MPRCAEPSCARWRPERLAPRWAIGIRMNGAWFCSATCVERAARAGLADSRASTVPATILRAPRLGVLLRNARVVTDEQLAMALRSQRESGCRIGAELQRLGYATSDAVVRALAAQHGVKYLTTFDVSRLTHDPVRLPVQMVRALALLPFALDEAAQVVHVICAAPVPRAAVRAMRKLTGWSPEVYLVADDMWQRALAAYEPVNSDAGAIVPRDADEAAAVVAETASADRAVTMRLARWERFAWVRVEGPTQVSNLLVPEALEESCRAVPTAQ